MGSHAIRIGSAMLPASGPLDTKPGNPLRSSPLNPTIRGKPMEHGCLEVAKGCGRISILVYTVAYNYIHLKNALSEEELQEFRESLSCSSKEIQRGSSGGGSR